MIVSLVLLFVVAGLGATALIVITIFVMTAKPLG